MSKSWKTVVALTVLAIVFSIALTFTAVEIPRLLDAHVGHAVASPALATGQDADTVHKTRLYMDHFHLREIGYAALAVTILLIVIGLAGNRTGMASAGAILLFLPVFGQFAATMFFLGGLAFLRLLWLPFLDISFDIMRLGDIAMWPYRALLQLGDSLGLRLYAIMPPLFVGIGFFFFVSGTLAWFVARSRGRKVADFWIYRISRHPQYLGWIIWSFGILLLPGDNQKRYFDLSNTLPWVLSTLVIVGVALFEELKMRKVGGREYLEFQRRTPFLFPLPRLVTRLLKWPHRLIFHKHEFGRKREILAFLLVYAVLLLGLSAWSSGMLSREKALTPPTVREMRSSVDQIRHTGNRLVIRRELKRLAAGGDQAVPHLLTLLRHENPIVRWYTADTLGEMGAPVAVAPLVAALKDPHRWVRNAAAGALGRMRSGRAVPALINALHAPLPSLNRNAARALGAIGDPRAREPLEQALSASPPALAAAAAEALGQMGHPASIAPLLQCLEQRRDCPFNQVAEALRRLGSPRALDAFSAGLQTAAWWQRGTALQGLAALGTPAALRQVTSALNDPEPKVRRTAVWVLRKFPRALAPRIRQALEALQSDPDLEVRLYAQDTLEYFGR